MTTPHLTAGTGGRRLGRRSSRPSAAGVRGVGRPSAFVSLRLARALGLFGYVLVLAVPWVVFIGARSDDPFDATFTSTAGWTASGVEVVRTVGTSPLRAHDVVVAVDGMRLAGRGLHVVQAGFLRSGAAATYTVRRAGRSVEIPVILGRYPVARVLAAEPGYLVFILCFDAVALVVMAHRPRAPAAQLLLLIAALQPLAGWQWPAGLQVVDIVGGHVLPYVVAEVAAALTWAALLGFSLVFPRPAGLIARRPGLIAGVFALPFVLYAGQLLLSGRSAAPPRVRLATELAVSTPAARVLPALVIAVFVVRYHRERVAAERRRLRWVLGSIAVSLTWYLLVGVLPSAVLGHWLVPTNWVTGVFAIVPVAVGAGILRHQLFGIDVVATRWLVWIGLTAAAVVAYAGVTVALWRLFGHGDVAAAATGAVALVILGIRDRSQRRATTILYGDRGDPYRIIDKLSHIDPGQAPQAVLAEITGTVAAALRLPYVALEITTPAGDRDVASTGESSDSAPVTVPLTYHGEDLGILVLATDAHREELGDSDSRLLADLGWHVAAAVHAVRVGLALQRSRQQLVTAREEERRRVRRDLHDGLGPSLAAAAMQLEVAGELVDTDPVEARAVIARVQTSAQAALTDIRRLVDDLRPPTLDQLGLLSALRERATYFAGLHARSGAAAGPLTVTVDGVGDFDALPAAVEVAVYRIGIEAVTNTARHSAASSCHVQVERRPRELVLTVTDDGGGIPEGAPTHLGLASMRERTEELGGAFGIEARSGGGTVVQARFPLPSSASER